jgi:hypothetical protein
VTTQRTLETEKVFSYEEISKYHELVDRSKKTSVRLTKQQYSLFKRLNERDIRPLRGLGLLLDMLGYMWTLAMTVATAKYIFLLAHFHKHDRNSVKDIRVVEEADSVVVTFNASAPAQDFNMEHEGKGLR